MKRLFLLLALMATLPFASATAAPVTHPSNTTVTVLTPLDELLKILSSEMILLQGNTEYNAQTVATYNAAVRKVKAFQQKNGSYVLTAADRDAYYEWGVKMARMVNGSPLSAAEREEAKKIVASYKTLNDLINDMELELIPQQ